MQLREALEVINSASEGPPFPVLLACGFTPLHLRTFLTAHLQKLRTGNRVEIRLGLYDDLLGTLDSAPTAPLQGIVVALEWPDLDPRLGLRQLGGWSPARVPEIVDSARQKFLILEELLEKAAAHSTVVLSGPLLELPPLFFSARRQLNPYAAELVAELGRFLASAASKGVRVLDPHRLPADSRSDIRSYLYSGFPYQPTFASLLGKQLADLLLPPPPKKGLITDLDDTLWKGILGEVGADHVSWDLNGKAQIHGVYQTLLQSLADAGTLVAVASKNDPQNVEAAFRRQDLLLSAGSVFPVEAGWGAKSEAVARILDAWNISADAVVFVDDSPMELAEVAAAFPEMTTLPFPSKDAQAAWNLIGELRDHFGKTQLSEEDRLRTQSLRSDVERRKNLQAAGTRIDEFLSRSEAVVEIEPVEETDTRALELVNKTNQFNLNGRRRTDQDWSAMLAQPATVARVASYEDKYGRLGKIAVLAGEHQGSSLRLHTWVMSCRAFSRRIEFQCLRQLFDEYGLERIELEVEETPKNQPLREFLRTMSTDAGLITRESFEAHCPALFHSVRGPAIKT